MTKTPDDYPLIKFRPGEKLEQELASRTEPNDSAYARVSKRDLQRLYALYALCLPTFSEDEAFAIVNTFNGFAVPTPERAQRLYVEVQVYMDERGLLGETRQLVARLKGLHRFECMAIIDAVERYWQGSYSKTAEEAQRKIREVGLVAD